MLEISWHDRDNDIILVKETRHLITGDHVLYWYYNINKWRKSNTGKKDAPVNCRMSDNGIAWVKKYYLPKL